jgi:hypothetical protein
MNQGNPTDNILSPGIPVLSLTIAALAGNISNRKSPQKGFYPMTIFDGKFDRYLDIDFLRASGTEPKFFLNFIQLKLDDQFRMHFWHDALPGFAGEEELHDHRYDFRSRVLVGQTTHEEWYFTEDHDGSMEIIEKSCQPGNELPPRRVALGEVRKGGTYTMVQGSEYHFPHDRYHRIETKRCVTLLERGEVVKDVARIIKKVGDPDFCPFEQQIAPDILWDHIEDLLAEGTGRYVKPGYHLRHIDRGVFGEASKIVEEIHEFEEALEQGADLMALIELSDCIGAMKAWLANKHPSMTLEQLEHFSNITQRAFRNGRRS